MKKYPRIPHVPGSNISPDDEVFGEYPKSAFFVFEKMDGANLGISLSPDSYFMIQNRGGYLENKRPHPQWDAAQNWFYSRYLEVANYFYSNLGYTVFGEWLYVRHSIKYTRLPSYFFVYDVFNGKRFLQYPEIRESFSGIEGFFIQEPVATCLSIENFIAWSKKNYKGQYGDDYEGFIFRDATDYTRVFKYVKPEFTAGIEEHWFNRPVEKNQLIVDS